MRKISVYSLLFLGFLVASCGNSTGNSEGGTSAASADAPAAQEAMMAMPAQQQPAAGMTTIPAPTGTPTQLYMANEAIGRIASYRQMSKKLAQNSFVFSTQQLLDYINTSQSSILNFVVGVNTSQDSLLLFVTPVGKDGRHQYYDRNDTCFVLTQVNSIAPSDVLEQDTATINAFFMEAMEVSKAQGMINAYKNAVKKPQNNGWLYNAKDLSGYLQAGLNAQGGMPYVQFILALDDKGGADFIIVGVTGNGNHMYFEFNDNMCVMENLTPCPFCDIASGGTTFDSPPCTFDKSLNK